MTAPPPPTTTTATSKGDLRGGIIDRGTTTVAMIAPPPPPHQPPPYPYSSRSSSSSLCSSSSNLRRRHRPRLPPPAALAIVLMLVLFLPPSPAVAVASTSASASAFLPPGTNRRRRILRIRAATELGMSAVGDGDRGGMLIPANSRSIDARDRRSVLIHLASCVASAVAVSTYEDYDVTHLKPNVGSLRRNNDAGPDLAAGGDGGGIVGAATRGLGVSTPATERAEGAAGRQFYDDMYGGGSDEVMMRPSYNDVMRSHRDDNVETWRQLRRSSSTSGSSTSDIIDRGEVLEATEVVRQCVSTLVRRCKPLAENYEWDELRTVLSSPLFAVDMGRACHVLFYSLPPPSRGEGGRGGGWTSGRGREEESARTVIGFDWGSCAWRHCGALADAQESLAELRNSLGMLEPYECLFVLDIVERSLRDVLAVVPSNLGGELWGKAGKRGEGRWWLGGRREGGSSDLPPYVPYRSREDLGLEGAYGYDSSGAGGGDGESSSGGGAGDNGLDYMSVLARFRNDDI